MNAARLWLFCLLWTLGNTSVLAQTSNPAGAPTTSLGTLEYGADVYYPQSCQHNGTTVACAFVLVHQAEPATIRAGGGGSQLTGIAFVDDAHVPHQPNNAYFVDRYGARQHVLTVNRGDQGTMVVEFPLVDASVTSGSFVLGTQVLSGIPVGQNGSVAALSAPSQSGLAVPVPALNTNVPNVGHTPAQSTTCNTAPMARTAGCRFSAKAAAAQNQMAAQATAVTAPISAISNAGKQLGGMFTGIFGKPAAAPATPAPPKPGTGQ